MGDKKVIDDFVMSGFKKMNEEEATLMPFGDSIIHDGIVAPYGVCLGKNMSD